MELLLIILKISFKEIEHTQSFIFQMTSFFSLKSLVVQKSTQALHW